MTATQNALTISDSIDRQLENARLRVLVVGAGIAGATLAALLQQRGQPAAVVERYHENSSGGYMLGLLPLGGRVLNGLNLSEGYKDRSQPMEKYILHGRHGQLIRQFPVDKIVESYGLYNGIERSDLLNMLRSKASDINYGAWVTEINQDDTSANVTFSDGSKTSVDLVVIADGIHSYTRKLILEDSDVENFDTGWGGYVSWCEPINGEENNYRELWGSDWFMGLYPVVGRTGIFLGGRSVNIQKLNPFDYAKDLATRDLPDIFHSALATMDKNERPTYWPMADIRSKVWFRKRCILLGDAAAAFLPTAGVGASAAMDAAAALADELSRADNEHMEFALKLYERRQRPRTEAAQKNSRKLAKYMFETSKVETFLRDQAMRFYTLDMMINDIKKVMESTTGG